MAVTHASVTPPVKILCTHPGRYGDILWSLPTARALAEAAGDPVEFLVSAPYAGLASVIQQQPYIATCRVDPTWRVRETAPMTPQTPPAWPTDEYSRVVHLGYAGWPTASLPYDVATRAGVEIDLTRPWIAVSGAGVSCDIACGFTEEWFELKVGLLTCVESALRATATLIQFTPPGSRWVAECPSTVVAVHPCDLLDVAYALRHSDLFFGDCSALHVLAVAMGKRVVLMEPNPHRHNDVFYPLGKTAGVHLVAGNDGLPTFDSRHCTEALKAALHAALHGLRDAH